MRDNHDGEGVAIGHGETPTQAVARAINARCGNEPEPRRAQIVGLLNRALGRAHEAEDSGDRCVACDCYLEAAEVAEAGDLPAMGRAMRREAEGLLARMAAGVV
jgi:hypothetical protein